MRWSEETRLVPREFDVEIVEETALAMAQATIQNAIKESHLTNSQLAEKMGRPKSFISRMLSGTHNLTIKTFSRAMAACGFELQFKYRPLTYSFVIAETYADAFVPEYRIDAGGACAPGALVLAIS